MEFVLVLGVLKIEKGVFILTLGVQIYIIGGLYFSWGSHMHIDDMCFDLGSSKMSVNMFKGTNMIIIL
jgi:hypothetical protein